MHLPISSLPVFKPDLMGTSVISDVGMAIGLLQLAVDKKPIAAQFQARRTKIGRLRNQEESLIPSYTPDSSFEETQPPNVES
jgi:hypothetical protein